MMIKYGIIAGNGLLPKLLIDHFTNNNIDFFILAFKKQTDASFVSKHPHKWTRLGSAERNFQELHTHNVTHIVFAGGLKKPSLYSLFPDKRFLQFLKNIGGKFGGDDSLLKAAIDEIQKEGFQFVSIQDVLPSVLNSRSGILGAVVPTEEDKENIEIGLQAALKLGEADIGQTVVVQQKTILAVEAAEGTDNLIKRSKKLAKKGTAPILIKAGSYKKEKRADLPTIGCKTINNVFKAGFKGIAIEQNASIILEFDKVIEFANKKNIFLYSIPQSSH